MPSGKVCCLIEGLRGGVDGGQRACNFCNLNVTSSSALLGALLSFSRVTP